MAHYNSGLFTFHQHYRRGCIFQNMFSKQTLLQMEIQQLQLGMRPTDKSLRLFNPMTCLSIIAHYLAGSYLPIYICLPENRCASPF